MANLSDARLPPRVTGLPWRGVRYFCTTRAGGVSTGACATFNLGGGVNDDRDHLLENRRRLRIALPADPLWLKQVHGTQVADADRPWAAVPTADAAVTACAGRVLAILTADCLPVVMADTQGRVLGVAHAGWRGLAAGVLEQTLRGLRERLPGAVAWRAWVGPGIGQRHFEVGADVHAAFVGQDPAAAMFFVAKHEPGKWLADLPGLARHRLHAAGVGHIELSGYCTYGEPERFYSYRREKDAGRIATVAWLQDDARGAPSDLP